MRPARLCLRGRPNLLIGDDAIHEASGPSWIASPGLRRGRNDEVLAFRRRPVPDGVVEHSFGPDRKVIEARWSNYDRRDSSRFFFVRQDGRWVLDEVINGRGSGDEGWTLSALLRERPEPWARAPKSYKTDFLLFEIMDLGQFL